MSYVPVLLVYKEKKVYFNGRQLIESSMITKGQYVVMGLMGSAWWRMSG